MLNKIRQLFCFHKYSISYTRFFSGFAIVYRVCDKCGKMKVISEDYGK